VATLQFKNILGVELKTMLTVACMFLYCRVLLQIARYVRHFLHYMTTQKKSFFFNVQGKVMNFTIIW
jgi:hypothetical protein